MIQKLNKIILDDKIPTVNEYEYDVFLNPKFLYYHLTTTRANKGESFVKKGDYVTIGQVIGERDGGFFKQNIHSTISGIVKGIEKKFYRNGRKVDCIVVENDFKESFNKTVTDLNINQVMKTAKGKIIKLVEANSVIGLGGGAFPTAIKLKIDKKIDTVILNGVECEPYLVSDYYAILKYAKEVCYGLALTMKVYDAKIGYIAVKTKNVDLVEVLNKVIKEEGLENIIVKGLPNYYPQGYEKDVIKNTVGIKVLPGQMGADYGIMVINSTTSIAIYDAVAYNLPILTREFLVSGMGIKTPKVIEVKVGTLLSDVIELCGGYNDEIEDKALILGGPMMGGTVASDDLIISKAVSTVLVFPRITDKEEPCIRCGSCVYSCPTNLSPVQIASAVSSKNRDALLKLNLKDCILCGLCSYVCTSKIPLTDIMNKGKKLL